MIRENLRSQPFQDLPRIVEKYHSEDFNFEDKVSELLAFYFNILNTIYPTKLEISLIDTNVRPKRLISEIAAKNLMRLFVTRLGEIYQQVFNEPLPERVPGEYMKRAIRSVSTVSDRRFESLPAIMRINDTLRVKRLNRLKRVEKLEKESKQNVIYDEMVNLFGERLANEARGWLVMQYEGHVAKLPRRASRNLLGHLFLFLGEGKVNDIPPVEITGRLLNSNSNQNIMLTSRLTTNFNVHLVRGVEELQPEVLYSMRILLFTSLFYGLLPEILLRINEIYWGEGQENSQIYIDTRRNMSLEPKLYFVYDTNNPLQFNSMIKTTRFAKLKPLFDKFTEVVRSESSPEKKIQRIFQGFIRTFRIIEGELAKEMVRMMNEWEQWESYTTYDEEGVEGLPIKNMSVNLKVPAVREWIEPKSMAEPEINDVLNTFESFEQHNLDSMGKLNWKFYAKNKELDEYQFTELLPECIEEVNSQLVELGYPSIVFKEDYLEELRNYCRVNSLTLKVIGNQVIYYGSDYTLVASPSHLSLEQTKRSSSLSKNMIAQYRSEKTFIKKKSLIARERNPVRLEEWCLGKELPFDPEIVDGYEKELRNHFLCIDIESLSVEGIRQDPYLICAVGYLGDNSPIVYRAWSNKYIQRYNKGEEETIVVHNGDWSTEYCMILFVEWLALIVHHYTKEKPLYIWGFNSMSYELTYLLLPLSKKFGTVEMLGHPNDCRSFKVGEGRIIFADILKILAPKSLKDYCKEFNLIIKKQEFEIGNVKTVEEVADNFESIKKYCYLDCISTMLLIHKVQAGLLELANKLKIPHETESITRKITASAFGWFFYIQGFVKSNISNVEKKNSLFNNEPEELYQYQRSSYTGGVVQVYKYVHEDKLYKVDVNSMYPAMCLKAMPWYYEGEIEKSSLFYSLYEAEAELYLYEVASFELPATFIGSFVATKQEGGKNTYWNSYYGQKPIYVRGVVLKRILYHKGTFQLERGWRYSSRGNETLKEFSETFYKERLNARNSSIKELCKLMMNSVTGRCAMAEQREYNARNTPTGDLYIVYDQDLYLEYSQPCLPPSGRLVRITSMITDYAKVYLDELHERAGYGNVLYSDTDSAIVTEQGYINLGRPGKKSSILGEFKVEVEANMKELYFESGYFKNRKDYILKYRDNDGKVQYLHKSKGIPKKYIDRDYTEHIIRCFKLLQPDLVGQPFGESFNVGEKIKMNIWRGEPFYGTTIKTMLKKSSVIVDRYFEKEGSIGIPRNDKYF